MGNSLGKPTRRSEPRMVKWLPRFNRLQEPWNWETQRPTELVEILKKCEISKIIIPTRETLVKMVQKAVQAAKEA